MRKTQIFLFVFLGQFFTLVALFALPRPCCTHDNTANQSGKSYGTIEGHVVTSQGRPVASATVYTFEHGRSPMTITDIRGKFTLTDVSAGKHRIFAFKESDGFPNLFWSFYSEVYGTEHLPVVNVEENQVVGGVIIRLGPKASRLLITVIDAKTRLRIRDVSVALNHKGKPGTLFETGGTKRDGEFDALIPSSIPINVVLKAPGYKTWRYFNRRSVVDRDAVRVLSGSSRKMTVKLQRVTK